MNVVVFDYGAGNMHSISRALERFPGARVCATEDPRRAVDADLLVLPGVGAFATAAARLAPAREQVREALAAGLPCIGICLGMQLLFDSSDEGPGAGIGLVSGRVTRIDARRTPHIGWNTLERVRDPLFDRTPLEIAWFANGYACRPDSDDPSLKVGAWVTHETDRFPAIARTARTIGVQFHPEKSDQRGVAFLHACMRELLCA